MAAWGDVVTFLPWTIHERYGDVDLLQRSFDSMRRWVDLLDSRSGGTDLWPDEFQLGDWLDRRHRTMRHAKTDARLVATCHFARSVAIVRDTASLLGLTDLAAGGGTRRRRRTSVPPRVHGTERPPSAPTP